MFLSKNKDSKQIEHVSSVNHEGKVVVIAVDTSGVVWYTVKQDGFEKSALQDSQQKGWEEFKKLPLPSRASVKGKKREDIDDDQSVREKEKKELTYKDTNATEKYLLRSLYESDYTTDKPDLDTEPFPVQLVSGLDHIYVFRQSKQDTLLVDRFVLDGMTNQLSRKLDVRFKRSRQKYKPIKEMKITSEGRLNSVDSLDFRDANNKPFYEPTTELSLIENVAKGWFSVVLTNTAEQDKHRWHIFAYNKDKKKIELTTLRASSEGLFETQDYRYLKSGGGGDKATYDSIRGVIRRTLDLKDDTDGELGVTNGFAAVNYDVQRERQTESGSKELVRDASKVMLAVPTDKGTAAISFSISAQGTLSEIETTDETTELRGNRRDLLLPLNLLDNIRAVGDTSPTPHGDITGILKSGDPNNEDRITLNVTGDVGEINSGDIVEILKTKDYNGLYPVTHADRRKKFFDLVTPVRRRRRSGRSSSNPENGKLGDWKKVEKREGGLTHDGEITQIEKTKDGKLRISATNHGLKKKNAVQIAGTRNVNGRYSVLAKGDGSLTIGRKWNQGEAINIEVESLKRRGIHFDGQDDYIEIPNSPELENLTLSAFTIECWVKCGSTSAGNILAKFDDKKYQKDNPDTRRGFRLSCGKGKLTFGVDDDADNVVNGIFDGWHHIAISAKAVPPVAGVPNNKVELRFCLDGEIKKPVEADLLKTCEQPLRIGERFQGEISDLRIWNVARTEKEISNSMHLQLTGREENLVGNWRLRGIGQADGVGQVYDFSPEAHHGIVYGKPYAGGAKLNRTLDDGKTKAVKYTNEDLYAVTEGAMYVESFEFKVINKNQVINKNRLDPNKANGKTGKLFTLNYWGKHSRGDEEKVKTGFGQSVEKFKAVTNKADADEGWYRAEARFMVPEGVRLVRYFEISNVTGEFETLEIRKHKVSLVSDTVTRKSVTDLAQMPVLAGKQAGLQEKVDKIAALEAEESKLVTRKKELDWVINARKKDTLSAEIKAAGKKVDSLQEKCEKLKSDYETKRDDPRNYWCKIVNKHSTKCIFVARASMHDGAKIIQADWDDFKDLGDSARWKFEQEGDESYKIVNKHSQKCLISTLHYVSGGHWGIWTDAAIIQADWDDFKDYLGDSAQWTFEKDGDHFKIAGKADRKKCFFVNGGSMLDGAKITEVDWNTYHGDHGLWKLDPVGKATNTKVEDAFTTWDDNKTELKLAEDAWNNLLAGDKAALEELIRKRKHIKDRLKGILNEIRTTTKFFESDNNPAALDMKKLKPDSQGLQTLAALLPFAQPATRLTAIESCEGRVTLNYFDSRGAMRQTHYDTAYVNGSKAEQWLPDKFRTCLEFKKDASITLPPEVFSDMHTQLTIEFWARGGNDVATGNSVFKASNAGKHCVIDVHFPTDESADNVRWLAGCDHEGKQPDSLSKPAPAEICRGVWNHWAFTKDTKKGEMKIYLNGILWHENNPDANDTKKTRELFGITECKIGDSWQGQLSELRIWNVAVTAAEIEVNSKVTLSGYEPGLVAYYRMDEDTGDEARHQSNNKLNLKTESANRAVCTAPIGNIGNTVMKFNGTNDGIKLPDLDVDFQEGFAFEAWVRFENFPEANNSIFQFGIAGGSDDYIVLYADKDQKLNFGAHAGLDDWKRVQTEPLMLNAWTHVAVTIDKDGLGQIFLDGKPSERKPIGLPKIGKRQHNFLGHDKWNVPFSKWELADVRLWNVARTAVQIKSNMNRRLTGSEPNLKGYWPLNQIDHVDKTSKVKNLTTGGDGIVTIAPDTGTNKTPPVGVTEALTNNLPIGGNAIVSTEYSRTMVDPQGRKAAVMNRGFAVTTTDGVQLLTGKRIEELELKWIGNAQINPTLLGYIEGAPPVPTENLTVEADYDGATSVELTHSDDVECNWTREQDAGLGASLSVFAGAEAESDAGFGITAKIAAAKVGFQGDLETAYSFLNSSSVTASSSQVFSDTLELRGAIEQGTEKFSHLGKRYVPKNIGYALVISGLGDLYISKLKRSGKMVGYKVLPVEGIPMDVNTITFLMNPAYTMQGSLDGLTGTSATSDRFFRHVPDARAQYGSLYPASFFRLKEAYDLKHQIDYQDKRRQAYFEQFDASLVDETSLNRQISDEKPTPGVGVRRPEDGGKSGDYQSDPLDSRIQDLQYEIDDMEFKHEYENDEGFEKGKLKQAKKDLKQAQIEKKKKSKAAYQGKSKRAKAKRREIDKRFNDESQRAHASDGFAGWQTRMENLQVLAGKRNMVNTYVWDADGGFHSEEQQFANTVEHTIGGSFDLSAALGVTGEFMVAGAAVELTAQATIHLNQTMSKTQTHSKGFELHVDVSGVENAGVTDHNDFPLMPGEKVDRYRFMTYYLENSTDHFNDFFDYVVDPEWLRSNDEEARALRQITDNKPNKVWRVLHRVTYVERPALMGFGRDLRQLAVTNTETIPKRHRALYDKLAEENAKLSKAITDQDVKLKSIETAIADIKSHFVGSHDDETLTASKK